MSKSIFIILYTLFGLTIMYFLGLIIKNQQKFYRDNKKGTLLGKTIFSIILTLILFSSLIFCNISSWLTNTSIVLIIVSIFELSMDTKNKCSLMFQLTIFFILIGFYIGVVLVINDPVLIFYIIIISIFTDSLCNYFGEKLSRLPKELEWIRLRFPKEISKNKSFTAVIITFILLFFIIKLIILCFNIPESINVYGLTLLPYIIFGNSFGDAYFSVYKRQQGIDDYFPTLGPIGGLLDRVNSWIFAFIFCTIVLI